MKIFLILVLILLSGIKGFSEQCEGDFSRFDGDSFPLFEFENTKLPQIRVTSRSYEFSDENINYQILCYGWPPEVKKHGNKQSCTAWCIFPRRDESSSIGLRDISDSTNLCRACGNKKDEKSCKDISILKTSGDQFKLKGENASVIQMGSDKKLLVFQTTNGSKDLSKPYLSLSRESEFFIKSKLSLQLRNTADNGYINTSKISLNKAETTQSLSASSITKIEELIEGAAPLEGKRSCKVLKLNTSKYSADSDVTGSLEYSCQASAKAEGATGAVQNVKVKQ